MNNYFQQSAESGYFSSNWHLRFAIVQIENRIQEKLFVYALTQNEDIGIKKNTDLRSYTEKSRVNTVTV